MSDYNARSLRVEDLVRALQAAGSRTATVEPVNADVAAGAPANADGTMDILAYAAWILKQENGHGA